MMSKQKKVLKTIGLILLILVLITIYNHVVNRDHLFKNQTIVLLEEGWTYNNQPISFDDKIDLEANESYTISNNFDIASEQSLLIRTSLSNLEVRVDDQVICHEFKENRWFFNKPMASLWHIIEIPESGDVLTVTYQSPYKKMNGLLNPIAYGQKGDLLFYIYDLYGLPFIIDVLILFFGLMMFIIAYINPKEIYNNIWQVGMFSILLSFWMIAESRMLQFFSGSIWLIGSLAYISLPLIPIPLLFYIKSIISEEGAKPLMISAKICCVNLGLVVFMQLFSIMDFFESVWITHIVIGITILIISKQLFFEIKVKQNKSAKNFLFSLGILLAFVILDIFRFYAFDVANVTIFVRIGFLIFIILLGMETGRHLMALLKKSYKATFYEKLAYLDQLTQGPNRTAFEKDLEEAFSDEINRSRLRLVMLDMNQLKKINDVYGHVTGDEAIKKAYELITKHFSHLGKTYRIGGDEFACIIIHDVDEAFTQSCESLEKNIIEDNKSLTYPMGIALGSVTYDSERDTAVKKMIHRADVNMYQAKKKATQINLA